MIKTLTQTLAAAAAILLILAAPAGAQNDCDRALDTAEQGLALHQPRDPESMAKARDKYLEALDLCPGMCQKTPQVCANLADAYHHLDRPEDAVRLYKRALHYYPNYATPYFGLGLVYQDQGLLGFALDNFLKAYHLDRTDVEARKMAADIFYRVCDEYEQQGGIRSEDLGQQEGDRRNLENRLLLDKIFAENNRRLFYCQREATRIEFALRNVTFETGRANLMEEAYDQIDLVGRILTEHPDIKVILEGHTDDVPMGSRVEVRPGRSCADNKCLSQARAEAVKDALVERQGIAPERITVKAYGSARPLDPAKTPEARAKNRRVTLALDRPNR
jgi:outer membrane protein OmpA-like peptidoglycan-associated protein